MNDKIIDIIHRAGDIVLSAKCEQNDISSKVGEANFVTVYDLKVQNFLKENILKILPDATFLAEEDETEKYILSNLTVVIDPIDGTTNFIKGYNHSCISVGILQDGIPMSGYVYNPYTNETFTAEIGKGAYLNGKRIHISDCGLDNALISFGTSPYYAELYRKTMNTIDKIFAKIADIRRSGSAALDLCYVAAGRTELYFEYLLSPWDFAAGALIVKEAGGIIVTDSFDEISFDKKSPIIAGSKKAVEDFKNLIN